MDAGPAWQRLRRPSRFVGRRRELDTVRAACAAARAREPAVLLISGEPGGGKSRLLAEAAAIAQAEGMRWCEGYALEAAGMPPFDPIARALGAVLRHTDAGVDLSDLLAVLSAAGIAPRTARREAPPRLDPDAARLRLLDAIAATVLRLAETAPLALALDDMQWADTGTWEAIVYMVRAVRRAPVLVLLALRDETLQPGHPAGRAMNELNRLRLLVPVPLSRLGDADVLALVADATDGRAAPALGRAIVERSGGNPFFAEELIYDLLARDITAGANDASLPLTLRLAIAQRFDTLAAETRAALTMAAVIGRSFDVRVLAAALGWDRAQLERALAPAVAARLAVEESDGWRFVHDTVREAVYAAAGADRRRLHAAVAAALEQGAPSAAPAARLAALAHHWRNADDPAKGAAASFAAATAALALHAPAEALSHARAGRELRERLAPHEPAGSLAAARLTHGEMALAAGEYGEAEAALRDALRAAQALNEPALLGRIWHRLGAVYHRRESPDEAAGCLRTALALLEADPETTAEAAEVMIELAGVQGVTRANYAEAEALGRRALAIAEQAQRPALEASAMLTLASIRGRASDPAEARPMLQGAIERALASGELADAAEICATLANNYYWTGELRASRTYAKRRLDLAGRAHDVFGLRHAHSWLANLAWSRGEWGEARRLLREAEPVLARLESPEPIAFLRLIDGMIDYRTGALERAYMLIGEAIALFERVDPATLVWYAGWLPLVCLALGRTDEAERHTAAQAARVAALPEAALPARSGRALLAFAHAELGQIERGAACERALRPFAHDFHWGPVRRSLAALAALRGDRRTALADLALAEEQARREAMLPDLALILHARAGLLDAEGRRDPRTHEEAQRLLLSLRMTSAAQPAPAARGRDAEGGLTPREREVLLLVAAGKTNREIADQLVLSERTVINHLSHIFDKLGVDNRTSAAAWAFARGLKGA